MQRVGYHYDGGAFLVQLRKQLHHLLAILGIQVSRRLIDKNQLRMRQDGTGDGGALLLTARKLRWEMLGTVGYRYSLHHVLGTLTALLARYSHIQKRQLDVLHHIQLIYQVETLEHKTYHTSSYQGTLALLQRAHILAVEQIAAACRIVEQTYYIK